MLPILLRYLYTALFYISLPIVCLRLLWRSLKASAYRQRWSERFAYYHKPRYLNAPVLWLHTVSVGETIAAYPLAIRLLQDYPDHVLLMTTTTPTGSEQVLTRYANEIGNGQICHRYMPYDLPDCWYRFLSYWQPDIALFMETEVWPNVLAACKRRRIATILINARLSEKSYRAYHRLGAFARATFSAFTHIVAQTEADAGRLRQLSTSTIEISGNLKSDIAISALVKEKAVQLKKQWSSNGEKTIIIAASTHAGEDEIILSVFQTLLKKYDFLRLVVVPRHPERFNQVASLCMSHQLRIARRSFNDMVANETQVIIGDTLGELMLFYGASDIAIVGGSFITHGGHNLLEPAVWGLPVVSGHSVYNFSEIAVGMQKNNGLLIAKNEAELLACLSNLLNDKLLQQSMGEHATRYVMEQGGATGRVMSVIQRVLKRL